MTDVGLLRSPCDTVLTVTGERGGGASLLYGTDLSSKPPPEMEDPLGLLFFFPKKESMIDYAVCFVDDRVPGYIGVCRKRKKIEMPYGIRNISSFGPKAYRVFVQR